jgi:F-type H+-transporting ATPase subunit b
MIRTFCNRRKRWRGLGFAVTLLFLLASPLLASGDGAQVEAGAHGGHGEGGTKGWVATDTQRVLNFAVLAGGLFFLLRKPVAKALRSRIEGIEKQLKDLEARKQAAEKELAVYNDKIALLDKEAEKIVAEYVRQGEEARGRIIAEAEAAAQKLEEQAKRHIDHELRTVRDRLQTEIIEKALAKAEARLQERITVEDQDRLIDEYLAKVVAS